MTGARPAAQRTATPRAARSPGPPCRSQRPCPAGSPPPEREEQSIRAGPHRAPLTHRPPHLHSHSHSPWDSAPAPRAGTSSRSWPPDPGQNRRRPQAPPPETTERSGEAPPRKARWGRGRWRRARRKSFGWGREAPRASSDPRAGVEGAPSRDRLRAGQREARGRGVRPALATGNLPVRVSPASPWSEGVRLQKSAEPHGRFRRPWPHLREGLSGAGPILRPVTRAR